MDDDAVEKWQRADEEMRKNLPPGVKLVRTLRGHTDRIGRIAWSPDGKILASPSQDKTIRLWNAETGKCLHILKEYQSPGSTVVFDPMGHILAGGSGDGTVKLWDSASGRLLRVLEGEQNGGVSSLVFDPAGCILASSGYDNTIYLWELACGKLLHTLEGQERLVLSIAYDSVGLTLAGGSEDGTVKLWDLASGKLLRVLEGGQNGGVFSVAFDPAGTILASGGGFDGTVKLWELASGKLLRTLEGHTSAVTSLSFFADTNILASKSHDNTIRLWRSDNGASVTSIPVPVSYGPYGAPGFSVHPYLPLLATVSSDPGMKESDCIIHIYELDFPVLLNKPAVQTITYTSAKIVLVGDSGVGKTGLGWRLAHEEFKEHSSTHGQQFWLLNQLCKQRDDGAQCEAVLWDLAGQPDYRLIHALFLDDADLALVLFDSTRNDDPLSGVEYWLNQLKVKAEPLKGNLGKRRD